MNAKTSMFAKGRLKAGQMTEHAMQVTVFDVLRLNERKFPFLKWIYAVPNGGARHPAVAGKLKAEGVKRGISDICLPFQSADQWFVGAYIELKAGRNKPTPEQEQFMDFVGRERYLTQLCYSVDEVLNEIESFCGIKLQK